MNRNPEPPEDDRTPPGRAHAPERLAEIEQQLRKARPCPPNLDLAAIEQLARAAALDPPAADRASYVTLKATADGHTSGRHVRRYSALAGSWICGVVVGAAAMLLIEGQAHTTADRQSPTAPRVAGAQDTATTAPIQVPGAPPDQATANQTTVVRDDGAAKQDDAWLALVASLSVHDRGGWDRGAGTTTWRAGMCLPGSGFASGPTRDAAHNSVNNVALESRTTSGVRPASPPHDPEPAPDVTRRQLLQELLKTTAGPLL